LESRLIYIVSHNQNKIEWLNVTVENGAWIYIGNGDELRKEFINKSIDEYFVDSRLYIAWTRNGSKQVPKKNIVYAINNILGSENFSIWDTNFKRVIEFNKMGVMRFGEVKK